MDRFLRPVAGVHRGEEPGARHVNVVQFPGGPGGGLVGVQHRGGGQQLPDPVHERREQPGGLAPDACHEPGRDVHPGQRGDQPGGAGDRQVVRADRQGGLRVHSRPVLRPPGHPGRCQPDRIPRSPGTASRRPGTRSPPAAGRDASNTCRFCGVPSTGSPVRSCPQQPHAAGPHNTVSSGWGDCCSVEDCAPGCLPGRRRTCRAATGPAASSYTGCPMTAASTTSRSPYPDAAAVPRPARPAPRSARPARPVRGGQLIAGRGRPRSRALSSSSSATRARSHATSSDAGACGVSDTSRTPPQPADSYQGDTRSQAHATIQPSPPATIAPSITQAE